MLVPVLLRQRRLLRLLLLRPLPLRARRQPQQPLLLRRPLLQHQPLHLPLERHLAFGAAPFVELLEAVEHL